MKSIIILSINSDTFSTVILVSCNEVLNVSKFSCLMLGLITKKIDVSDAPVAEQLWRSHKNLLNMF